MFQLIMFQEDTNNKQKNIPIINYTVNKKTKTKKYQSFQLDFNDASQQCIEFYFIHCINFRYSMLMQIGSKTKKKLKRT